MVVRNVLPNLVERLQMMNPKSFVDFYDDGLQAEEMENEKKKNTRSTGTRNYPTGGTQQENTSRVVEVQAVQKEILELQPASVKSSRAPSTKGFTSTFNQCETIELE